MLPSSGGRTLKQTSEAARVSVLEWPLKDVDRFAGTIMEQPLPSAIGKPAGAVVGSVRAAPGAGSRRRASRAPPTVGPGTGLRVISGRLVLL